MAVTRQQIVDAAIALLDEGGLAGLTLRRLADRLGVGASTLYWHVRNKRELLDLISDRFMADVALGPIANADVWGWMESWGRSLFATLRTHPDSAMIMAGNRPAPETFPQMEVVMGRMVAAGFDPPGAMHALLALGAYVIGVALDVQEEAARPPDAGSDARVADFPFLVAAGYPDPEERFDRGLSLLLAGMRSAVG